MNRERIFLVEDNQLLVLALTRALQNKGYQVLAETSDFHSAVGRIKSWSPHVVLLDIGLAGKSGVDILEELGNTAADSKVVILTSDDSQGTRTACMNLGAAAYVTKPFDLEALQGTIRGLITRDSREKCSAGF